MSKKEELLKFNEQEIIDKIYMIRGEKVMIDRDLAEMYGVETKYLKRQVKRNIGRFPDDFMFQMNQEEFENWRRQFGTSNSATKMGLRYAPFVFTEQGVAQLSSVLNSKRAVEVNIHIIRLFIKMRKIVSIHQELLLKLEKMEKELGKNKEDVKTIFSVLKQLIQQKNQPRKPIGYKKKA